MTMPVDWSNPCQRAAALTTAYYEALAGKAVVSVSFADRSTSWRQADLPKLEAEMRRAQAECAAAQSGTALRPRRFAITAGTSNK